MSVSPPSSVVAACPPSNPQVINQDQQTVHPSQKKRDDGYRTIVALQSAAAISTLTFYPFDVVKMRFMSQDGTEQRLFSGRYYNSTFSTLRIIAQEEGIRTLFRGSHVSILGALVSWGVYMGLYQYFNSIVPTLWSWVSGGLPWEASASGLSLNFVSSCVASIASAIAGNPIWMVKTRMQLEVAKNAAIQTAAHAEGGAAAAAAAAGQEVRRYPTLRAALLFIYRDTGFKSLWRGLSAQILLSIPNAMTFPLYEWLKKQRRAQLGLQDGTNGERAAKLGLLDTCACSVGSKVSVSIFSHPLVVIKTRLMDERAMMGNVKYTGVVEAMTTMVKREGLSGFFRGIGPSMVQSVPRLTLHFTIYETLINWGK